MYSTPHPDHLSRKKCACLACPDGSSRVRNLLIMMGRRECRGGMDMPFPGIMGNPGSHLDQAQDEPFDRPPHTLASNVEITKHARRIVYRNSLLLAGFVCLECRTARLVPTEGILAPLIRFSISALPLYALTTLPAPSLEFETMNPIRGESSPSCLSPGHSMYLLSGRLWMSQGHWNGSFSSVRRLCGM